MQLLSFFMLLFMSCLMILNYVLPHFFFDTPGEIFLKFSPKFNLGMILPVTISFTKINKENNMKKIRRLDVNKIRFLCEL
ncbi:hypothetical protein NBO_43g0014 [Nosema bombycis CQ1]|uniref:Uncharacterized protein n=1 Tax=Nosema bombycis (strain CQ1 / CVCC 102059) TaxID=578461 RepID=R0M7P2_NOSB1|nr:hypothetical protein NBO_43g0014 [Nosema bombycis CQ1]|eukprot:EOB14009.1 hypothetical protein NBO_43g0014 [Nosema bombycis CQ1]